ncbi:uncharacterized protein BO97DRAFT_406551 [Aspergillus homomorphus CBS 101889]|uniref:Serine hydrolase domain-containing protein n=1 Tax=Aspergillus homomorphus (strain CBS 101889) TaxID=1450537 RepID=A0A395HU57_ASPHC|nr:hypothetical protein BO97DRAFT_406551 [Aspergillus homomorphus CBS 101889]RAL11049.1 hypothetical protein BO97DRAFT_406551 [Aspergillus homomorphus CBS 101889]
MRFLCLHGAGTSGEIFEIQAGGITYALEKKGHTFKFINGRMETEGETEIKDVFDGPFYSHYPRDKQPGEDLARAIEYVNQIIAREGPFDGVMGFSQGCALASAMIIQHAQNHQEPLFKLAVFICGASPFDQSGMELIEPPAAGGEYPITIPTTHIVGKQDSLYPYSMRLYGVCDPAKAELYDHGSRHLVPFDVKNTEAMIAAVEASIRRVMLG